MDAGAKFIFYVFIAALVVVIVTVVLLIVLAAIITAKDMIIKDKDNLDE